MNSYHFDVGNSNTGPIGFCARVWAESEAEALALLMERLQEQEMIAENEGEEGEPGIDYIAVYFNSNALSVADIDDWEPVEAEAPA